MFANRPNISFGIQAEILTTALQKLGHEVINIDHTANIFQKIQIFEKMKPDVVIMWTFFHDIGHPVPTIFEFEKIVGGKRNFYLVGFEVSDTTKLSEKALNMVNELNPDVLLTPSHWSARAFTSVNMPVVVLRHALSYDFYEKKRYDVMVPALASQSLSKVLIYAQHSQDRKGTDIAINNVNNAGDIFVVMKIGNLDVGIIQKIKKPKYIIPGFIPYPLWLSYFRNVDILHYPVRGGAFEIPVLEALALGKTVVIPEEGAWTDIPLNKDDVYWIKISGYKRYWFDNPYHIGEFVEPNKDDALEKLNMAIKERKSVNSEAYLKYYHPEEVAKDFLDIIRR